MRRSDRAATHAEAFKAAYLKEQYLYIRERIVTSISYPPLARKMGWCGRVKIIFVVCEDGGVDNARVVESSGFTLLDTNTIDTVKKAAPFPSPPVRAEIRMAITYRLD
jgi:protein TonB